MEPKASSVEQRLRGALPLVLALFAVLVDLAPRPAGGGGGLAPFLTLAIVYFWSVYRPDLMTYAAVFTVGLVYDVLSGQPLGATALALLLGRGVLIARHRFFYAKSFSVIWALFLLWAPAVELVRYLAAAGLVGALVDPRPLVIQCALTVALYPALSWILVRLYGQVRVPAYAEP
ncbi:MAG: rod shape-determining protein MreD [Deinococcus-Thermus bacterium]|jgi:rod shape-determining protein MreD|nr:rod shape-determining protein MreD [Deinococcota bacterium]